MAALSDVVAEAIQKADSSYFNENYVKQANAAIQAIRKAGYEIVPVKPPEGLIAYIHENMPFGRLRPSELISQLYILMVNNVRKFE
ncbi:conserved hypothetical protein [uncultured Gammaproteobacteria bacterium]